MVAQSDLFVGLIGHLNGSAPEGSVLSFTELEYEEAKRRRKPRLMFIPDERFSMPAGLREPEEAYQRQLRFRQRVGRERTVVVSGSLCVWRRGSRRRSADVPLGGRKGELTAGAANGNAGREVQGVEKGNALHGVPPQGQGNLGATGDHAESARRGQATDGSRQGVTV
jgi:hypothetical protein